MTNQEYLRLADTCLDRVADWLEGFDPDEVDYATTDGMVSLDFPDGKRFVLNRQSGNSQMWLAAGVRATTPREGLHIDSHRCDHTDE